MATNEHVLHDCHIMIHDIDNTPIRPELARSKRVTMDDYSRWNARTSPWANICLVQRVNMLSTETRRGAKFVLLVGNVLLAGGSVISGLPVACKVPELHPNHATMNGYRLCVDDI